MMKRFPTIVTTFLFAGLLSAQSDAPFHCGSGELHRLSAAVLNDPLLEERIAHADAELEDFTRTFVQDASRGGGNYVIPVVFHIIHNNGQENISDAQVFDAVRILNEDFNRLNPDRVNVRQEFQSIIADVGIQFRLATKDPEGVCTNGITRTVSELTNDGTEEMKALINWPRNKYLNVWVAASADGAAASPSAFFSSLLSAVGSVGSSSLSTLINVLTSGRSGMAMSTSVPE